TASSISSANTMSRSATRRCSGWVWCGCKNVSSAAAATRAPMERGSPYEVLRVFIRLGLTSFGGPIAHLGYFRAEFVERRGWLSERTYADLVALSQFLPGPASSQTGFGIGLLRGGYLGGLAAW